MNTHIEQITSEQTIGEINRLALSGDMLTTALSKPYADATGIGEVQPSAPVTSDVEEMLSWMTYLLRKIFGTTTRVFRGASLLSEFRAVYNWLRERLKGSADYFIPAVTLDPSNPMSEHLRLLDSRKIYDGFTIKLADGTTTPLPDGLSFAQLMCGKENIEIVEIIDDNIGWTMTNNFPTNITGSLTKLRLGCAYVLDWSGAYLPTTLTEIEFPELISWGITPEHRPLFIYNNPNITELTFPKCKAIGNGFTYENTANTGCFISSCENLRVVRFPEMYKYGAPEAGFGATYEDSYGTLVYGCPNLEELYLPKWTGYRSWRIVQHCPALKKLVLGTISTGVPALYDKTDYPFSHCTNLVHLEVQGCVVRLDLRSWSPTTALAERLPEFLSNFQTYIADRVADMTGKTALTLTLSSAVYGALEAQEGRTILATLTNKNWTVAQA